MVTASSLCFLIAGLIVAGCLPIGKMKSPDLYDQRQTGEYNIRLNLKDFHIIAILGGDYSNNDYEYDYEIPSDYTDFPVPTTTHSSPSNSTTTTTAPTVTIKPKPLSTTTASKSSTTPKPEQGTKPTYKVTTNKASSTTTAKPSAVSAKSTTTSKPPSSTTLKVSSTGIPAEKPNKTFAYSYQTGLTGDRIPVIVLQQNEGASKSAMITSHVTILPEEIEQVSEDPERVEALGEIHYKKCPNGYTRDKSGRCRKLRRPPLFDFSRFTSNLASKFRRPEPTPVRAGDSEKQ